MHKFFIIALLLLECLTHIKCAYRNATHPIYLTYAKLREDILARPAVVHRIPPRLESLYQERYILELANLFININSFDEISQVMTVQFYFLITWYHSELTWDPSDFDNIREVWINSNELWTPVIEVNMGQEESSTVIFSGDLKITSEGAVSFMKLGHLSFDCQLDFQKYPFDSQTCTIGFYPHGPPYAEPQFTGSGFSLSLMYNSSKEWVFHEPVQKIMEYHEGNNKVAIKVPTYILGVKRKVMYYVITIIFPLILTSVMIPLVFVIPAHTGEKVSYLVAIFTSTAIFLNFISDVMPRSLVRMPYLAALLTEVVMEGFLAILATLLVVNIYDRERTETLKMKKTKSKRAEETPSPNLGSSKQPSATHETVLCFRIQQILTSKRMDISFFLVFFFGQTTFLLLLFKYTDWVILNGYQLNI